MRALLITILCLALASCGTFRRVVNKNSTEEKITRDSSAMRLTTKKETIDTTIKIKGDTAKGSKPVQNLIEGDSLVLETPQQQIIVKVDDGQLKALGIVKDREVPVQVNREETTQEAGQVKTTQEQTQTQVAKNTETDTKNTELFIFLIVFSLLALVALVLYILRKIGIF